jgi:hypothetical protein
MNKPLAIVAFGITATGATYFIDMGCSCGSALGFPFSYIHPFKGCFAGNYVIPSNPGDLFDPVFDYASAIGNIALWSLAACAAMRLFSIDKKKNEPNK